MKSTRNLKFIFGLLLVLTMVFGSAMNVQASTDDETEGFGFVRCHFFGSGAYVKLSVLGLSTDWFNVSGTVSIYISSGSLVVSPISINDSYAPGITINVGSWYYTSWQIAVFTSIKVTNLSTGEAFYHSNRYINRTSDPDPGYFEVNSNR